MSFAALGLKAPLLETLTRLAYQSPTPVQTQAIPAILSGRDLMAAAESSAKPVIAAIEAQRDFWLAETDLQLALTGTSPGALTGMATAPASANPTQGH